MGRSALRMDQGRFRQKRRLFGINDVTSDSLTRLRTRIDDSGCRLIASRTALRSCGLRLGRLLRLSKSVRVSLCLPRLDSDGILVPLPRGSSICGATLDLHPRVRTKGLGIRDSSLDVGVTHTKCLPALGLDTNVKDAGTGNDSFDFDRRIGRG